MKSLKTAIIDIGSNTIRLVVYKYSAKEGLRELSNIKTSARLRSYILPSGEMSEEGIQLLETTLASMKEILDEYGVSNVFAAATAAVRQATNQSEIVKRMKKKTGIQIVVLSGEEEAYFGYLAVVHSIATPSAITIDIGGGSTEITMFKDKQLLKTHSFPFGTVSLKQRFVKGNLITAEERKELVIFLKQQFKSLSWIQDEKLPIIGIGGSARNVAQIHQQQRDYPISGVHQYSITRDDLHALANRIGALNYEQLKRLDGLSSDRADTILPATEVFKTLMEVVKSEVFQFTNYGIREGIIIDKILQKDAKAFDKHQVLDDNITRIAYEFGRQASECDYLSKLSEQLYKECCRVNLIKCSEQNLYMITRAAKLYSLGEYIEISSSSQHTFYLIANQSIEGITHNNRVRLALLASYKNKDYFRRFAEPFTFWFSTEELNELRDLGALLKFIYALNISKRLIVSSIQLEKTAQNILQLHIYTKANVTAEKYQAEKQKKHLERALKYDVQLNFIEER